MRVLVIPDLHCPFEHRDALKFLKAVRKKFKTTEVVCLGDEVDMAAVSDYTKDPDGLSPGDELKEAVKHLKVFYKEFPKAKVCTSNHTARPYRRAFQFGIPSAFIKSYHDFLQAPIGWTWAESYTLDGVRYEHGEGYLGRDGALKAANANGRSTVIGHIHSFAGIQYSATPEQLFFGFNSGCLINRHAYAFAYGKHMSAKPILGCGVVIDGTPHFIPLRLNKKHRWTGKL